MRQEFVIAGFGGQGVLSIGLFLANAGLSLQKKVIYVPSYGAEMRGGTCHCMVTVADKEISSPVLSKSDTAVVMNLPSLEKFEPMVRSGGNLLINQSLIKRQSRRRDISAYGIPTAELAHEAGVPSGANMVMLGALLEVTGIVHDDMIYDILVKTFKGRYLDKMPLNMAAINKGQEYVRNITNQGMVLKTCLA